MDNIPAWIKTFCIRQTNARAPLFQTGHMYMTPGVSALFGDHTWPVCMHLIARHVVGDWGQMDPEDQQANRYDATHGARVFSAYTHPNADGEPTKVWVITEADRAATTVLLPDEY